MNRSTTLVTLLLFMIVISLFTVSALNTTTDSANITSSTGLINQTGSNASINDSIQPMSNTTGLINQTGSNASINDSIQPMSNTTGLINQTGSNASINDSIQPMSLFFILTVPPTSLDLGTVDQDVVERSFTGVTTVRVRALAFGRSSGNLYVRASGDFINSADPFEIIPLTNFQFSFPGHVTGRPFTTTNQLIHSFSYNRIYDHTYTMNYYLRVPLYTYHGVYTTTITYTVIHS